MKKILLTPSKMVEKKYSPLIPIDLGFFEGGGGDKDSKTEEPTAKKRQDARKEGQVAKSEEVSSAISLLIMFFSLSLFAPWLARNAMALFKYDFGVIPYSRDAMDALFASGYLEWLFLQIVMIVGPLLAISFLTGLVANLIQVGWEPTVKPMMPKLSKINPISGFKRIFSMESLVKLVKSLAKFAIIGTVVWYVISAQMGMIPTMIHMELLVSVNFMVNLILTLGLAVGSVFILVALADYIYQRYSHTKKIKMTKQEVKDEYKQMEGDPQIKGKIRQKMREASMRRMMQNVPEADVVITNPTHFAVALRYNNVIDKAPVVLAKGMDFQAKRIREKAKENDIPLVENASLARALYAEVEVGDEIPYEMWESVVEILAYVFKLRNQVS